MSAAMRIIIIACCTLYFGILAVTPMLAKKDHLNLDSQGRALKGYDPVAYFVQGQPTPGSKEFEYRWNGSVWQFSTEENMKLFRANAEKYTPAYGGYCAWAVAEGYTADIDPKAWTVFDGKLYLNYNLDVQKKWGKDIPGNIDRANKNWPGVLAKDK
jgi:YHS domain-containing protein